MSLGSPARAALALLASALVAVVAPAPGEAKVLRTNLRADPAMVDPVTYSELVAGDVMKNLYEGFTEIDKDGNIVPALAIRWEANPDNKGFRFHLRKGVKFHSGREFTAKDVKWTFEQILLPGNKGGLTLTYLKVLEGAQEIQDGKATQLSGVKVVDPYTVDVRFTRADVLFPIYPFQFMDSGIVAQHGADWPTKVSAGTGPFKFVHWKRGQEVRLAAHKDYWGQAPSVDEIAMLIVPSFDTAVSMYEANELDVVDLEVDPGAARAEGSEVQGRDPGRAGGADPLPRHEPEPLRAVQGQARPRGDLPLVRPRGDGQGSLRRRRRARSTARSRRASPGTTRT